MPRDEKSTVKSAAFIRHLTRFPEDLRDIRRLQRKFRLSAVESARALEAWRAGIGLNGRTASHPY
jgi:hypothetical protein